MISTIRWKDLGTPARASERMVDLEVDGIAVSVPEGTSVLRAAADAGISIPKLCATDSLEPFGSCRLCLVDIAGRFGIPVVEDAAESLGSLRQGRHTGTFGRLGVLSFNGNKTITTGGGGMVITNDAELGKLAKHLTTTAKLSHPWEYVHDHVGYNYRLPNLNAALGVAQMEQLPRMVGSKRALAEAYRAFFASIGVEFLAELPGDSANYWLNAIVLDDFEQREHFLKALNARGVMCRPIWRLMNRLPMFAHCQTDSLENALWLEQRVVNIPSSARP